MEERKVHLKFEKIKGIRFKFIILFGACREDEYLNGINSCEFLK